MSDQIEELVNTSFRDFGAAIQGSLKLEGAGVDVSRAWGEAVAAKAELAAMTGQIVDGIQAIHDNPMLPEIQKAAMLRENADLFDAAEKSAIKRVQTSLAHVRATLEAAAISDLVPAEASERSLIRDEIDKYIAGATKPKQEAWGGSPFKPGDSVKEAMLKLVQQNPARYGAEIASDYGKTLLGAVGAGHEHAELVNLVRLSTPGQTPKAQNARLALDAMKRTKIEGMPTGLSFTAKQKVEAALQPPAPARGAFRPDTIPAPR